MALAFRIMETFVQTGEIRAFIGSDGTNMAEPALSETHAKQIFGTKYRELAPCEFRLSPPDNRAVLAEIVPIETTFVEPG